MFDVKKPKLKSIEWITLNILISLYRNIAKWSRILYNKLPDEISKEDDIKLSKSKGNLHCNSTSSSCLSNKIVNSILGLFKFWLTNIILYTRELQCKITFVNLKYKQQEFLTLNNYQLHSSNQIWVKNIYSCIDIIKLARF